MSETTLAADAAPSVVPGPELNIPAEVLPKQDEAPSQDAKQAEPEAVKEGDGNEDKPEKPKRPASERIGELYGKMKSMERERDQALTELQRLRQPIVDPAQYDQLSYDQQQQVQMRQAVREERAAEMELAAQSREREAQHLRGQQYQERLQAVAEKIPDLYEKLNDESLPISDYAAQLITESDQGPQVAYWLATNRAEATRISRLPPLQQAKEIGRIEAKINSAPVVRKVTSAPAPVPTVGSGGGAGGKDVRSMSVADMQAHLYAKR